MHKTLFITFMVHATRKLHLVLIAIIKLKRDLRHAMRRECYDTTGVTFISNYFKTVLTKCRFIFTKYIEVQLHASSDLLFIYR